MGSCINKETSRLLAASAFQVLKMIWTYAEHYAIYTTVFKQQPITRKQLPHSNALLTEAIKAWPCLR